MDANLLYTTLDVIDELERVERNKGLSVPEQEQLEALRRQQAKLLARRVAEKSPVAK